MVNIEAKLSLTATEGHYKIVMENDHISFYTKKNDDVISLTSDGPASVVLAKLRQRATEITALLDAVDAKMKEVGYTVPVLVEVAPEPVTPVTEIVEPSPHPKDKDERLSYEVYASKLSEACKKTRMAHPNDLLSGFHGHKVSKLENGKPMLVRDEDGNFLYRVDALISKRRRTTHTYQMPPHKRRFKKMPSE